MRPLCLAILVAAVVLPAHAADKNWTRLDSCRYVQDKNNDGDSFLVQCGKEKFYARFYFIDAPEKDNSAPQRVQQQYEYFCVTTDELTHAGNRAQDFVFRALSARPFVVHTKKASAQGRAKTVRYYSIVEVDGRYLHEIMVSEGHARNKGTRTVLPTGEKSGPHTAKLAKLEDQARASRKGAWSTMVQSRCKSPL